MLTWQSFFLVRQQRQTEVGTLQQPPDTEVTDWEERVRLTMLHLLVGWCCEGRGHWCGRACAIIRERNWLEVSVRSLMASTYVFVFLLFFFLSVDFADIENLGGWVINKLGNTVWRVNMVLSAHAHITPLHPASAAMLQFRFIFSLSRWKFRLHSRLQRMTSL